MKGATKAEPVHSYRGLELSEIHTSMGLEPVPEADKGMKPEGLILAVMIPCYNEEETIADVIRRIPRKIAGVSATKVVVIDDGSDDNSYAKAQEAGADLIIRHKRQLGLGKSFRDGLNAALSMPADIIVNIDADGQYDPAEIPLLIEPILRCEADIVLGNRQVNKLDHMPLSRKWGNHIASWATRRLSGLGIQDAQTGFRALTRDAALRIVLRGGYTYTQEMIIQAAYRGLVIQEVPVTFHRRSDGGSRLIKSAWAYAIRSGAIMLRSYRDNNPMKVFSILATVILAMAGVFGVRVLMRFYQVGTVSPYLPSAIMAAALAIIGIQAVIFGLLADMLKTQRELEEEILIALKMNNSNRRLR